MKARSPLLRTASALVPLLTAGLVAACATQGGEDDDGQKNLPDRGIVGWLRVGDDTAPYVLAPSPGAGETWGGPSALVVDGAVVVWFHAASGDAVEVRRALADASGATFGAATVALADARDPSVARSADGTFWMAFGAAEGGLGLASSADGQTFAREAATGLPADAIEPSLVVDGDRFVVFAVSGGAIVRAEAGPDLAFGAAESVLAPESGCVDAFGKDKACWDGTALSGPDVRLAKTALGRRVWRMFFAGRAGAASDLGFAASYDGHAWSRYLYDPVQKLTTSELAPSAVYVDGAYLLYFVEQRSAANVGIALGRSAPAAPSDTW